jgi:hypothetical protein
MESEERRAGSRERGIRVRSGELRVSGKEQWGDVAVERWKCRPVLFPQGLWSLCLFLERVIPTYSVAEGSMFSWGFKVTKYVSHFCLRIAFIKEAKCS